MFDDDDDDDDDDDNDDDDDEDNNNDNKNHTKTTKKYKKEKEKMYTKYIFYKKKRGIYMWCFATSALFAFFKRLIDPGMQDFFIINCSDYNFIIDRPNEVDFARCQI